MRIVKVRAKKITCFTPSFGSEYLEQIAYNLFQEILQNVKKNFLFYSPSYSFAFSSSSLLFLLLVLLLLYIFLFIFLLLFLLPTLLFLLLFLPLVLLLLAAMRKRQVFRRTYSNNRSFLVENIQEEFIFTKTEIFQWCNLPFNFASPLKLTPCLSHREHMEGNKLKIDSLPVFTLCLRFVLIYTLPSPSSHPPLVTILLLPSSWCLEAPIFLSLDK